MSADRTQRRSRSNPGGGWADRLGAGRLWGASHARSVGGQVVDCDAACGGGVVEAGVHAAPESALADNAALDFARGCARIAVDLKVAGTVWLRDQPHADLFAAGCLEVSRVAPQLLARLWDRRRGPDGITCRMAVYGARFLPEGVQGGGSAAALTVGAPFVEDLASAWLEHTAARAVAAVRRAGLPAGNRTGRPPPDSLGRPGCGRPLVNVVVTISGSWHGPVGGLRGRRVCRPQAPDAPRPAETPAVRACVTVLTPACPGSHLTHGPHSYP